MWKLFVGKKIIGRSCVYVFARRQEILILVLKWAAEFEFRKYKDKKLKIALKNFGGLVSVLINQDYLLNS